MSETTLTILEQWTEPTFSQEDFSMQSPVLVFGAAGVLTVILAVIGYTQKEFTYYLAALVPLTAAASWYTRRKRPSTPLEITLTSSLIVVGQKEYSLSLLAGFWLSTDRGAVVINIEPQKAAIFPISFLYHTNDREKARELLLEILPEVEPRPENFSDTVSKYIRF